MFCYQCERAANGKGCTTTGACGKTPEVSDLQDLLVYSLQGLSVVALECRKAGVTDREVDEYTVDALFSKWPLPGCRPQGYLGSQCIENLQCFSSVTTLAWR